MPIEPEVGIPEPVAITPDRVLPDVPPIVLLPEASGVGETDGCGVVKLPEVVPVADEVLMGYGLVLEYGVGYGVGVGVAAASVTRPATVKLRVTSTVSPVVGST